MKKYMLLEFYDFDKDNNHYKEIGSLLTKEEIHEEINKTYGEKRALENPNIRVIHVENHSYGMAAEPVAEHISEYMKDNMYDEVCAGSEIDSEAYNSDIDYAFEDVEVKAKLEELVTLINNKANIKYYLFQAWDSITYSEFKE